MKRITAQLWLSYFIIVLIKITSIAQSREYHVKDKQITSYMYKRVYNIKENIFPADISINVSVSRSVGTLLYSIDKNMNQLIVSLYDGIKYVIKVELNKQEAILSLPELCGCERCLYDILNLRIQLNTHINIRCNGRNPYSVRIMNKKELDENYPILYPRMNTNKASSNEAHMWFVNTPQYNNVYPNNLQMYGCIFDVSYMDKPIRFTNTTSDITHPCIKQCIPNVCNSGQCFEAYNDYPVCNCTTVFLNGRYCNESIRPINLRSYNQLFHFDMIKLSWNSSVNTIFTISNRNVSISLDILKDYIFVELKYLKKYLKVTLYQNYVHDNPSICIAYFQEKFINIWLFNNGSWINGQILSEYELKREIFDSLTLLSGNGNISLHTKSDEEYAWRKINIADPIEIKNEKNSGQDNVVPVNVNNQGSWKIVTITVFVTIIIVVPSISIVIVFVKRRKNIKYSKLKGNDDDKEDTQKKNIVNMKDQTESPLIRLFKKEHKEYIKICMREFGNEIVKKGDKAIERMHEVMKNITQEETYLSDIIVLLIHTRIVVVPSMASIPNNHRSIQYLAALLSDKYNHKDELQRLSEQVIECMMDFLEDLSTDKDTKKTFDKLLDEMLAFVGYNIIINKDNYKYQNKRNVTFLEDYLTEDTLERLWSAVIMYAHTGESTYIAILKKHLNENFIQGENLSNDMIMLSIAIPILCVAHNFKESILTDIDYLLIVNIEKYKILSQGNIEIFTVNIINIFNHQYKEGIIQRMKDNSDLTEEQKMAVKCLKASLLKGLINEDTLMILTSLLNEFYPYATKNNEADQIMQSVLNHLFENKHYKNETIKYKLYKLCIKCFDNKKISDGIKLSSSMIICYTAANMTDMPDIDEVIKYLSDVNGNLIRRKSESINLSNYTLHITEIERVLSLMTPEQDKNKDH